MQMNELHPASPQQHGLLLTSTAKLWILRTILLSELVDLTGTTDVLHWIKFKKGNQTDDKMEGLT